MHRAQRFSLAIAAALALAAPAARAQPADAPVRIYGIELERARGADRLLVLADGPLAPQLEERGPEQLALRFANARLDPSAAKHHVPGVGSAIREVTASESEPPGEVVIRIRRAPGIAPRLSREGSIVALELARPAEEERRVTMRFKDAPLAELVREVAKLSGTRFLYDDRLQGTATIIVNEPVTPGESLEILHSTLLSKGFAAVPSASGVLAILPIDEGKARAPKQRRTLSEARAGLVTLLARFHNIPAETLVNVLQPFTGASLTAVAYAPTNGVILVGSEAPLARWLELAKALDDTSAAELAVIRLRQRGVAELLPILEEASRDPLSGRSRVELWSDERTSSLIVRGTSQAVAAMRARIAELDALPDLTGEIAVIRPSYADPEKLAKILEGLAAGSAPAGAAVAGGAQLAGRGLTVSVHASTGALVVAADPGTLRVVRDVVAELDREAPVIALELQVLDITTTGRLALGFDAFIPLTDPELDTFAGVATGDPLDLAPDPVDPTAIVRYARDPLVIPVVNPDGTIDEVVLPRDIVQLKAAAGELSARTLMSPHLLATSGEEHELAAGLNVPIPNTAAESAVGATEDVLTTRVSIDRQDVGLRVRVKPLAGQAGEVKVTVDVELSNVLPSQSASLGPSLGKRTLHATARLAHGRVAVLGMALEQSFDAREFGAPFLKDVPVAGNLVNQTLDQSARRHLLVAIQARIERSADERIADAIRLRTAHERALARHGALREEQSRWALLVSTRTREEDARALAESVGEIAGRTARVIEWEWADARRYDVVLSGFASITDASAALPELETRGFTAQLLAVPRSDE